MCQGITYGSEPHRRYCSDRCRQVARVYRDAHRSPRASAREEWGCVACGAPLDDKQRATRRFCSTRCRVSFWRAMQAHRVTLTRDF